MTALNAIKLQTRWLMRLFLLALYITAASSFVPVTRFRSAHSLAVNSHATSRSKSFVLYARSDEEDDDEEEEEIDLSDQDWRAFRAKLVMQKPEKTEAESLQDEGDLDGIGSVFTSTTTSNDSVAATLTPLDPSQWAYDSGNVIEQGAVILGGVEQDYGFGLRQQYFHKAAILVLDHEESTFTKGIILNRPSDLTLDDDLNKGVKWRVYFGGDVQGLNSNMPEIVCLHSLKDMAVTDASIPVMKDIQVSKALHGIHR